MNTTIDLLMEKRYDPIGVDHELQADITDLLDRLIRHEGKCTLAELGYLHMSTMLFDQAAQRMELKVYFDARFAARVVTNNMMKKETVPVQELTAFQNYLYVGQIGDVVSYEEIMGPRGDVKESARGRASLVLRGNGKLSKYNALVINCNIPITFAALCEADISNGKHFEIQVLNNPASKETDDIVVSVSKNMIPVGINVRFEGPCYKAEMAIPYLRELASVSYQRDSHRTELVQDIREKAEKNKKKAKTVVERRYGGLS